MKILEDLDRAWIIFCLALALSLPFQGCRPFRGRDEHRYPQVAYQMLVSGDFLIPRYQGRVHLTKPPLTYWVLAAGEKIFGFNPWGARVPNALAYALTATLVFLIGRELWGVFAGRLAAYFYLSMLVPFAAANVVTTDTLLTMFETAALWALVRGFKQRKKGWLILMWVFWGLAFMTKGMAIFPILGGSLLFWWLRRQELPHPFPLLGLLLFLAIVLPWHLYVALKVPGTLKIFWQEQIYGRLFSDMYHRNSKWFAPFYLYLPLLTLGALPASFFWLRALKTKGLGSLKMVLRQEWPSLWVACQFFFPLVVFWVAKSRLPLYILPLFVPLALATARMCPQGFRGYGRFFFLWFLFLISLKGFSCLYFSK